MSIYESKTYIMDLFNVTKEFKELDLLRNSSILITGATGLICSSVVDILLKSNEINKTNIHIYAAGRNEPKMRERFAEYLHNDKFHYVRYDATKDNKLDIDVDYVIHGASNAYPSIIAMHPVETMLSNFMGIQQLLELARTKSIKRVLYISSSEIYGLKTTKEPFKEDEYGYIDILNSRNSYSSAKRASETLCISYTKEFELDTVIVRPGHIYGPTASKDDNRVSSMFAYNVVEGKNIILKSAATQVRSYCYIMDCATAILTVLLKGSKGEAYNISNRDSMISIKHLSELFAKYGNVTIKYENPNYIEKVGFNPMTDSSLSSLKLEELGWRGKFDAELGVMRTLQVLKELKE